MMGRINYGRLFLGGLLAGSVANLLQFTVNRLYLFRAWEIANGTLGLPIGGRSEHLRGFFLATMTFMGSIFAVWLYVMLRARFGSGPKTAALAGGIFWLMSWLFPVVLWSLSGPFPTLPSWLLATHLTTYLAVAIVATMVGAWQYKEFNNREKDSVAKA
jgi:hypothetical protein